MKKFKKSLSVVLCVVFFAAAVSERIAYAAESGVYCDFESGVLYVSGSGEMAASFANDTSVEEIYIERGVTAIPAETFKGCTNLKRVTMSNTVALIGIGAFSGCASLNELTLSEKIIKIPEFAFSGCESLADVKIPDSCVAVDRMAFSGCSSLEFAVIPDSVSRIHSDAFYNCSSLESIYYAGSESEWKDAGFTDFSSGNITFIKPEFYIEKTVTQGNTALSLRLGKGGYSALDVQLAPQGECSVYRIQVNRAFTSATAKNTGMVSMYSDDNFTQDGEVVKVTYNVGNCENSSVNISFLNCAVAVGRYIVNVPVGSENRVVNGSHTTSEWKVTADPSAERDGTVEALCGCCGTVEKNLPYAFKNCTEENGIVFISEYGLNEEKFRAAYITSDAAAVTASGRYAGTGTSVKVDYSDGIVYNYSVSLKGDTDGDGLCNAMDSLIIGCVCEGMISADNLDLCVSLAADCNRDSVVNAADRELAELNGIMVSDD